MTEFLIFSFFYSSIDKLERRAVSSATESSGTSDGRGILTRSKRDGDEFEGESLSDGDASIRSGRATKPLSPSPPPRLPTAISSFEDEEERSSRESFTAVIGASSGCTLPTKTKPFSISLCRRRFSPSPPQLPLLLLFAKGLLNLQGGDSNKTSGRKVVMIN